MLDVKISEIEMTEAEKSRLQHIMSLPIFRSARKLLGLELKSLSGYPFKAPDVEPTNCGCRVAVFNITKKVLCNGAYESVPLGPCSISFLNDYTLYLRIRRSPDHKHLELGDQCARFMFDDFGIVGPDFWFDWHGLPKPDNYPKIPSIDEWDDAKKSPISDFDVGDTVVMITGPNIVTVAEVIEPDLIGPNKVSVRFLTPPFTGDMLQLLSKYPSQFGEFPQSWLCYKYE